MDPKYQNMLIRLIGHNRFEAMNPAADPAGPHTIFAQPITGTLGGHDLVVGHLVGLVAMKSYLSNLVPSGVKGITMVVANTCGEEHSFLLEEGKVRSSSQETHHWTG